jgi:hypothetical protein
VRVDGPQADRTLETAHRRRADLRLPQRVCPGDVGPDHGAERVTVRVRLPIGYCLGDHGRAQSRWIHAQQRFFASPRVHAAGVVNGFINDSAC